jgi:hypothetical protein
MPLRESRGAATVEHAGLCLLIAALAIAGVAALAGRTPEGGRELGFTLARKLRCAAQGPGPCWRDPLTTAYGRELAGAVRALAPNPEPLTGPGGTPLLPVDFRACRQPSCAAPGSRHGLTASNRRVTTFVAVGAPGTTTTRITYWNYRPTLGWREHKVTVSAGDVQALGSTPLLDEQVPVLVSLETLPGANHFDFSAGEEPPWRWQIERH